MTKKELRLMAGCTEKTFSRWLKRIEPDIPDYRPTQRLLTPAQVKFIIGKLCLEPD